MNRIFEVKKIMIHYLAQHSTEQVYIRYLYVIASICYLYSIYITYIIALRITLKR